jgi:hypothetical protein
MQQKTRNTKQILKRIGYLLGSLVAVVLLINLLAFVFINPIVAEVVKENVRTSSGNLYSAEFEKLRIDLFGRSIRFVNFKLVPNRAVQNRLKREGNAPATLFVLEAGKVKITQIDFLEYFRSREARLGRILVNRPEVTIYRDLDVPGDTLTIDTRPNEKVSAYLTGIFIREVAIENGTFNFMVQQGQILPQHTIRNVSVLLSELRADSLTATDPTDMFRADEIAIAVKDYTYYLADSAYICRLDQVNISSRNRTLSASGIAIVPDTADHQARVAQGKAEHLLFGLQAKKLEVSDIDIIESYQNKDLKINTITLQRPEVIIYQDKSVERERKPAGTNPLQGMSGILDRMSVNDIAITEGRFTLHMLEQHARQSQVIENVTVNLVNIQVDSLEATDPNRSFYAEEIRLLVKDYTYYMPDSLYLLKVGELYTSSLHGQATFKNLRMQPRHSKANFMQKVKYRTERMDVTIGIVDMKGADLKLLFNEQKLHASDIKISNAQLNLFRDNRKPLNENRRPQLLHKSLKETPLELDLQKVSLSNIHLQYEEIAENGKDPGKVTVEKLQGTLHNVSNRKDKIKKGLVMKWDIQGYLMGKAKIDAVFKFPMNDPAHNYSLTGTMAAIQATELNQVLEPVAFIKLEEGDIQKAEFAVFANDDYAYGDMRLYYKGLKVRVLEREPGQKKVPIKADAASFLANNLLIKSDNPPRNRPMRLGDITLERDKQRSMIYHLVHSLLDGVRSSIMGAAADHIVDKQLKKRKEKKASEVEE